MHRSNHLQTTPTALPRQVASSRVAVVASAIAAIVIITTQPSAGFGHVIDQDPLSIPSRIGEVKSFTIPGATLVDWQNKPILNTAGEPPEPFDKPEQVLAYPLIKNIPGLGDWLFDFESVINADAVRLGSKICEPKTLMIRQVTVSDEQTQGDIKYRTATLELWRRKSQWVEIWPSRGFTQLVTVPQLTWVGDGQGFEEVDVKQRRPI